MKRLTAAATCMLALAAAGGCGGDDGDDAAGDGSATRLEVVIRPQGPDGPAKRRRIECDGGDCARLGDLTAADLAPVRSDVACAEIYGGRAVATVTGTLRGEPVKASFDLTNACESERWRRNRTLLGAPPRS